MLADAIAEGLEDALLKAVAPVQEAPEALEEVG
jgi:hypothetical protein